MSLATDRGAKLVTEGEWEQALRDARVQTRHTLRQLPPHVDGEEALSCAVYAVVEAARCYDPAKGAGFGGWARQWINWRLRRWVVADLKATRYNTQITRENQESMYERGVTDPEAAAILHELLRAGMATLTERQALVITLTVEGLDTTEIAGRMGVCYRRVVTLRVEARKRLREVLG